MYKNNAKLLTIYHRFKKNVLNSSVSTAELLGIKFQLKSTITLSLSFKANSPKVRKRKCYFLRETFYK